MSDFSHYNPYQYKLLDIVHIYKIHFSINALVLSLIGPVRSMWPRSQWKEVDMALTFLCGLLFSCLVRAVYSLFIKCSMLTYFPF